MSTVELGLMLVVGLGTGVFGAMLGIGGGVLIIPILVLGLGIPIHATVAASLVSIIATSSAAASVYLGNRVTNIRLGMALETATAVGGMLGGIVAVSLGRGVLLALFAAVLVATAVSMWRRPEESPAQAQAQDEGHLGSHYHDPYLGRQVRYRVVRFPLGWGIALFAGVLSGLLGIGGGVVKVPTMVLGMGIPVKAAAATSDFMIGVTAVSSAYIYYAHGDLDVLVAAPLAAGAFLGSLAGAHLAPRLRSRVLTNVFAVLLAGVAVEMGLRAVGIF